MQSTVLLVSAVLMAVIVGVFAYVAANAGREAVDYAPVQAKAYGIRLKLFWVLVVASVLITAITTLDLPYAATRGDTAGVTRNISVHGGQWYWQVSESVVEVGDTVLFAVTSADVNHGLGVYNAHSQLIGQTQAMPGYTNVLKLTFEEAGAYKLVCMEYCGLAHHGMVAEIEVKAN